MDLDSNEESRPLSLDQRGNPCSVLASVLQECGQPWDELQRRAWSLRPLAGACCHGTCRRPWSTSSPLFSGMLGPQPAQKKEQSSLCLCIYACLHACVCSCVCVFLHCFPCDCMALSGRSQPNSRVLNQNIQRPWASVSSSVSKAWS